MLAVPSVALIVSQPKIICARLSELCTDLFLMSKDLEFCQSLIHMSVQMISTFTTNEHTRIKRAADRSCSLRKRIPTASCSDQILKSQSLHLLDISTRVIWHTVSLSFNECLVSLMTFKCDSLVLGLKRKVLWFTCCNPTVSRVAIILLYSSPLLGLWAQLNYPTTHTCLLTAVLAGVSFPDVLTSLDWKLVSAPSHQQKQLTSSTSMPFH